jgi:hypothetical protein
MRLVILALALAACTKPNPAACCDTPEQCTAFGISGDPRHCAGAQVCDMNGACVDPECQTSMDCTSPGTPICVDHFCQAKCVIDADCAGVAGRPVCETDGSCGECKDDMGCTDATKPVCDMTDHSCRGCIADNECPSGVCVEAEGRCAATSELLFLSQDTGSDSNDCSSDTKACLTFGKVLGLVTAARGVVRIVGGQYDVGTSGLVLSGRSLTIDAGMARLDGGTNTVPVITVRNGATVTVEGVSFQQSSPVISVGTGAAAQMFGSAIGAAAGSLDAMGGNLGVIAVESTDGGYRFLCESGGVLTIDRSHFARSSVNASDCDVRV